MEKKDVFLFKITMAKKHENDPTLRNKDDLFSGTQWLRGMRTLTLKNKDDFLFRNTVAERYENSYIHQMVENMAAKVLPNQVFSSVFFCRAKI